MKTPEELIDDLLKLNESDPPKNTEVKLLRLSQMILDDRFALVESIAKACGSPESHKCSCGALYFFIPTKKAKFQPIVPDEGISHFITCRDAPHWRDVGKTSPETPPPAQGETS